MQWSAYKTVYVGTGSYFTDENTDLTINLLAKRERRKTLLQYYSKLNKCKSIFKMCLNNHPYLLYSSVNG